MKRPEKITLQWLQEENGPLINAFHLVYSGDLSGVPKEMFPAFLKLKVTDRLCVLHVIVQDPEWFKQLPADALTAQNLTTPAGGSEWTPLHTIAMEGNLQLLAWKTFKPTEWISHFETIKRIQNLWPNSCREFYEFVRKVEGIKNKLTINVHEEEKTHN